MPMVSNLIKLCLGIILLLLIYTCQSTTRNTEIIPKLPIDSCRFYRYDANQIVSNLGCQNCHLMLVPGEKDDRGWATFSDLVSKDSLKLIDYVFNKKHKGWYSKTGTFKASQMDTLSDCEIRNVIRFIKDFGRDVPMPSH